MIITYRCSGKMPGASAASVIFTVLVHLVCVPMFCDVWAEAGKSIPLRAIKEHPQFKNVANLPYVITEQKYASKDNFMKTNLYGEFKTVYLHSIAYAKLKVAAQLLNSRRPGWKLKVFDGLRPRSVQWVMWRKVKGTPQQAYVADPAKGSIHNFGLAVDLTIVDAKGNELDMGTEFDDFRPLAQPVLEQKFLRKKLLSRTQIQNRKLLRDIMIAAGFIQFPIEWWHFDALPAKQVRRKFPYVN